MTKYVYVVNRFDMDPYESHYMDVHKVFSIEEYARAYVEDNEGKVFPEDRKSWDSGWGISSVIQRVELEE